MATGSSSCALAMFAGGGVLSASKNEWAVDEGWVGVGTAAVGLAFVFKELVPEWL